MTKATVAVNLSKESEELRATFLEFFRASERFPILEVQDRYGDYLLTVDATEDPDDYNLLHAVTDSVVKAVLEHGGGIGDATETLDALELDATILSEPEEEEED